MDPASIIGLVGSVLGIADVVTRSIKRLSTLRTKYQDAPFLVSNLIGQLCTVEAALDQLSVWTQEDLKSDPRYTHLASQVSNSLDCFGPLIVSLQKHLDQLDDVGNTQLGVKQKMTFIWNEKDLQEYVILLSHQINALTLLLQAIQW